MQQSDRLLCLFRPDTPTLGSERSDIECYKGKPDSYDYHPWYEVIAPSILEGEGKIQLVPYMNVKQKNRLVCLLVSSNADPLHESPDDKEEGLVLEQYGNNSNHYIRIGYFSYQRDMSANLDEKRKNRTMFGVKETDIEERTIQLF